MSVSNNECVIRQAPYYLSQTELIFSFTHE